ncbi:MAG: inositol monophosphatase [candidate division Zixibacteria bacterium]|nr:inositol monophosphatase [candidate division Zixibacteria bacterium]
MEMEQFKKIATQAALKGGEILNEHRGKVKNIGYKDEVNLVTEVDRISEETILQIIKENFPDHAILTEESEEFIPESKKSKSIYKWIIDPLDGTTNYAHGFPIYCVSIALEKNGEIILGVVYDPNLDELFVAEKGKGAFLSKGSSIAEDKHKISVSQTTELSQSLLATGFPYDIRKSKIDNLDHFANFYKKAQAVRRGGSAALDLCYLAMGRFDGFWELKLHPWDMAAGKLMVEEAGGKVTDFLGGSFNIYLKEILASNGKIHPQMIEILKLSL